MQCATEKSVYVKAQCKNKETNRSSLARAARNIFLGGCIIEKLLLEVGIVGARKNGSFILGAVQGVYHFVQPVWPISFEKRLDIWGVLLCKAVNPTIGSSIDEATFGSHNFATFFGGSVDGQATKI
mmetsp:Transcript_18583/g.26076  ORF Transcript_18583/g.26076 Transcript_18583/m.26076 type:complete len:126 (+) Transcript_18583:219-596(+)